MKSTKKKLERMEMYATSEAKNGTFLHIFSRFVSRSHKFFSNNNDNNLMDYKIGKKYESTYLIAIIKFE